MLIDKSGNLRLVDYDDMFLPSLAHLRFSPGKGRGNPQHPGRGSLHYDREARSLSADIDLCDASGLNFKSESLVRWTKNTRIAYSSVRPTFSIRADRSSFRKLDSLEGIREFVDRFASICLGAYEDIPSLTEFIEGRFPYARYAPNVTRPQGARPAPGTRPVGFIPDGPPVPYRPVSFAPPLSPGPGSTPRPWALLTVIGAVSAFVIVVAFLGLLTQRHSQRPVASVTSPTPRSHAVARAPAPPDSAYRNTPRSTHTPREQAAYQAPSTSITQRAATAKPAPASLLAKETPKGLPVKAPAATSEPAARRTATHTPATAAVAAEPPEHAPTAAYVAKPELRNACSTPDSRAHIVSLAAPELSNEKRLASAGKSVTVTVDIAADGSVTDAAVRDSAGDVALDFAALGVARHSTYAPAEESCATAAGSVDVTVSY